METRKYRSETVRGINVALQSVPDKDIDLLIAAIQESPRVFFSGAGRSFLMLKATAMAMMQIGISVYVTGEVTTPGIKQGDLLVVASCSGETKSVQLFVDQARKTGAKIVLITGNADSTMAKKADIIVVMASRPEPGSIQESWITDNRFEQAIVPLGDCLVEFLARQKGASGSTIGKNHANME
jgi:6-phospho-3-hexuloisomerase